MASDLAHLNLLSFFRFQGVLIGAEGMSDLCLSRQKTNPAQVAMLKREGVNRLIIAISFIAFFSFARISVDQFPPITQPLLKKGVQLFLLVAGYSTIKLGVTRVMQAYRTQDEKKQWEYIKEGGHHALLGSTYLYTWFKSP